MYWQHSQDKMCCSTPLLEPVEVISDSGAKLIREQCKSCGCVHTKSIKKGTVLPGQLNAPLRAEYEQHVKAAQHERFPVIQDKIQAYRELSAQKRRKNYEDYLSSEQWKQKRLIVLQRDNYLCQSCLANRATEVHHLDYTFLKNEPLFTLVSVCRPCHISIEAMKKGLAFQQITHTTR
jgi:5-methylcytosine-specific restriction endonuclease McrA